MAFQNPLYLQSKGYTAQQDRELLSVMGHGEGVPGGSDLKVTSSGSGLGVSIAAGECFVRGDTDAYQGLYQLLNDGAVALTAATADGTHPRLDQIVVQVRDPLHGGGAFADANPYILTGTPASGADLDTRTGAATLPDSTIRLADLYVPASFAGPFVDATHLRDRRPITGIGVIPGLTTAINGVLLVPALVMEYDTGYDHINDNYQSFAMFYIPRRIVNATRIRWKYRQSPSDALAGNYAIGVYDASGRKIIDSGAVSFSGAVGVSVEESLTISATTFEPGVHFVGIGFDTSETGVVAFAGVSGTPWSVPARNMLYSRSTGGTTLPSSIPGSSSLIDFGTSGATGLSTPGVPQIALSVG